MTRYTRLTTAAVALAAALSAPAFAGGPGCGEPCGEVISPRSNVQVEIVAGGGPLVVYRDGPYRWVEGRRGERFSFRITNRNGFPVGVIPSADGQSLTADGRAQAGNPAYVVEPYGSLTVGVWREDLGGGRELVFTDVESSLAARKGDRRNVGVLGVLVWQLEERVRPLPRPEIDQNRRDAPSSKSADARGRAPSGEIQGGAPAPGIGVGAGDRRSDPAYLTDRYRRVRVLDTVAIYYDDRAGLARAGVDLGQYGRYPDDRRRSDPFPGEYRGVRIP